MFNKNFQALFCYNSSSGRITTMAGSTSTGNLPSNVLGYTTQYCHYGALNATGAYHVIIGAGDTAATIDDYDLADSSIMAADKMQSQLQMTTRSRANGAVVSTQWYNSSAAPITVKEIGLAYKNQNAAYSKAANYMIGRKVLDTPVTIQPGETYIFSYRVTFEQ